MKVGELARKISSIDSFLVVCFLLKLFEWGVYGSMDVDKGSEDTKKD